MLQTKREIKTWLNKMDIDNYTINNDLTVDVNGNVLLYNKDLLEIPIQFNIINGVFSCAGNNLISLKGCPRVVKGNFSCVYNKYLKSMEYLPIIYGKELFCDKCLKETNEYKKYQLMQSLRK